MSIRRSAPVDDRPGAGAKRRRPGSGTGLPRRGSLQPCRRAGSAIRAASFLGHGPRRTRTRREGSRSRQCPWAPSAWSSSSRVFVGSPSSRRAAASVSCFDPTSRACLETAARATFHVSRWAPGRSTACRTWSPRSASTSSISTRRVAVDGGRPPSPRRALRMIVTAAIDRGLQGLLELHDRPPLRIAGMGRRTRNRPTRTAKGRSPGIRGPH